jgi:uroporphyrinogen-III synthase
MADANIDGALAGRRIVVPETREIEVLAGMLERHGADGHPLSAGGDPRRRRSRPDRRLARTLCRDSARRSDPLHRRGAAASQQARRHGRALSEKFVATLAQVRKITRGPKPARRLRELGLKPDLPVEPPTTAGIIATLSAKTWLGGASRCSSTPTPARRAAWIFSGAAGSVDPVLPYAYASAAEEARVVDAIRAMAAGEVDLIAFTSTPQLHRLRAVARANHCEDALAAGFAKTRIAAVGPVVAAAIEAAGGTVAISRPTISTCARWSTPSSRRWVSRITCCDHCRLSTSMDFEGSETTARKQRP